MPDDPNTGDVTGTPPPWVGEPVVLPEPSPPTYHARCIALEAAARTHQKGGTSGFAAPEEAVLGTAEKYYEWLLNGPAR